MVRSRFKRREVQTDSQSENGGQKVKASEKRTSDADVKSASRLVLLKGATGT